MRCVGGFGPTKDHTGALDRCHVGCDSSILVELDVSCMHSDQTSGMHQWIQ